MLIITGAAGFIGANLAQRLAAQGHELLLVDHPLTAAKAANWVGLEHFRFCTHERLLTWLDRTPRRPTGVFHLGACSRTTVTDWEYLAKNNVGYTQHLWAWCAAAQVPFLYASSAATYGDGARGFDDRTPAHDLEPLNLYGRSKNDFDRWALDQVAAGQPRPPIWAGLKFFNVYGPREAHKGSMASVVWQAYRQITATGRMKLFRSNQPTIADGGQRRDFVYVEDCVDHLLWLWRHAHTGGVYNSGTGQARTFLDLVRATFAALECPEQIEFIPMPTELAKQYQNFTEANMSKLRTAGYSGPATALEVGVQRYVRWLQATGADAKSAAGV
jgi:ADP-L-glycero-D-manno-heptose 6-epimerase